MKTRSAYLALVAVALTTLAGGVGFLYSLQPVRAPLGKTVAAPQKIAAPDPAQKTQAEQIGENPDAKTEVDPAGQKPHLFGLRTAIAPSAPVAPPPAAPPPLAPTEEAPPPEATSAVSTPAPAVPGLALVASPAAPDPAKPPEPAPDSDQGEFEGDISSLEAGKPKPPARPADLAGLSSATPTPPRRPGNLEALAAPDPAETSAMTPLAVPAPAGPAAPLPPARPADLASLGAAPTSAAPEAPATQQVARLPEPTMQAAPEDAFQGAPPKFGMGDPVFVRIFKQEGQLELWLKKSGRYHLYKTFPICKWSGRLGPKVKEADYQSPEGFYSVSTRQLNPHSNYYRAFNVGYPNAFDKQNGRTGGLVMVHGACKSVGCFAMTDRGIEEIYGFVEAALKAGQRDIAVHIFPFRMTDANIARETGGGWLAFVGGPNYTQWSAFWRNLKEGYDLFEQTGEPPTAFACGDHYEFGAGDKSCRRIAGW
jgi:murein L,D-transpeptidase YafK